MLTIVNKVGSHYHFTEVNKALKFDRSLSFFRRLDIAAGTAVRFEPGDSKTVTLVNIGGNKVVSGGNLLLDTPHALMKDPEKVLDALVQRGFKHEKQEDAIVTTYGAAELSRETYASMYGPTTGDRVRLGDTELWVEVEDDKTTYGDELKFGGGAAEFQSSHHESFFDGSFSVFRQGHSGRNGTGDEPPR